MQLRRQHDEYISGDNYLDTYRTMLHMQIKIEKHDVSGDLLVDRKMWFAGKVSGDISVTSGGELNLLGMCTGNLIVETDGHALVAGTVVGEAINRGGTLLVHGIVSKGVRTIAGNTDVSPHVKVINATDTTFSPE